MKKITFLCIFLVYNIIRSQDIPGQGSLSVGQTDTDTRATEYVQEENGTLDSNKETSADILTQNNIQHRSFTDLNDVSSGFYIVNGTYKNPKNLKRTVEKLKRKGFNAGFISNTDAHYTYLEYFSDLENVISAYNSKLDGKYSKDMWVLIANSSDGEIQTGTTYDSQTITDEAENTPKKTRAAYKGGKEKLIKKADSYFNKLWYAEAAELYERALKNNKARQDYKVIERAADAHYFNTNMERAYYWYDILYNNYAEEMSSSSLMKYSHALKGTGKYGRAKRLMRVYNNIKEEEGSSADSRTSPETILDNILNSEQGLELKNLAVNTKYSDFSPVFYSDDEMVFSSAKDSSFLNTRRYKWNNQPYLDLYVAKINEESQELRNATKFSKKINTKYHEASAAFSPDNTTMYFTRNNFGKKLKRDKNGVNHLKIYKANKVDGEWTEAVEVSFNSNDYSTGHPALSPDGKQLYFVSDMPGSIGETDIFVVDVLENGDFSKPRNLGPKVNTAQKEMFPFINDKKLYFSSNGHIGLGGLDVYEAMIDENEGFTAIKNVGKPINSEKDDFSYIVDEETQKGFFASNREGGKGDDDIYSFTRLIVEEDNKNAIAGVVTELVTGEVMPEALVILLDENNIKLKEMTVEADGSFIFEDLDSNTKYTLKIVNDEYFEDIQDVTTKDNEIVNTDVSMKRLKELIAVEDGIKKLKLDMIYFDFDKNYIREDAARELNKLVEVMTEYKDMVIKIESHTDSRGSETYNEYLSDKRAKSTRDYLISKGIATDRIESAIGYGEERLLNHCDDGVPCNSATHELNRRSEFIIVKM